MSAPQTAAQKAIALFRQHAGILRTGEALDLGIYPRTLYALHDAGLLVRLSRGLYRLSELPPLSDPDLVLVALRVPQAVICLLSALAFHELTDTVPDSVHIALRSGSTRPRLEHPPLRTFWFSGRAWSEGVATHHLDGVSARCYGPEKSVADCFKYRHRLGRSVALEALRRYCRRGDFDVAVLLHFARICRVERAMTPYLEALL